MRCKIEGCNHTSSVSTSIKHGGSSWANEGICPCCALECLSDRSIEMPRFGTYRQSNTCNQRIKKELEAMEPKKTRTPEQLERYKLLKKYRQKHYVRLIEY